MTRDPSLPILIVGLVRVAVWFAGAGLAYWRRRWAVSAGFALAGVVSIINTIDRSGGHVDMTLIELSALAATPVAALIVGGFIANQPRFADRPSRWSP